MAEHVPWSGVLALREREILLRTLAGVAAAPGDTAHAGVGQRAADRIKARVRGMAGLARINIAGA